MRTLQILFLLAATSTAAFCLPGGVLANVRRIQIDPTVIAQPEKVKDSLAANLVRFDLRAAVRDAYLEEGDSPIRAHIVLDEFSRESTAKRLIGFGTGRSTSTVDGRLVIQDASGKELASVKIHVRGSVAFSPDEGYNPQGHQPTSDFEKRLLEEIERLK
jgi:hypothetical protein